MTITELLAAVEDLSFEELLELQKAIEKRRAVTEKLRQFDDAIHAMRDGLSEDDIDAIEWAMNVEFPPKNVEADE